MSERCRKEKNLFLSDRQLSEPSQVQKFHLGRTRANAKLALFDEQLLIISPGRQL